MNQISSYLLGFSQKLKSGELYKAPLSEAEKQGHTIVSIVLEKAAANADIMASLASDILNHAVVLQAQINATLAEQNKEVKAPEESAEEWAEQFRQECESAEV